MDDLKYFSEKIGHYQFNWVFYLENKSINLTVHRLTPFEIEKGRIFIHSNPIINIWSLGWWFSLPFERRQRALKWKAIRQIRKSEQRSRDFDLKFQKL
jgi:hypothetical protein